MKGFLQYLTHNLLISKVADLQPKKALNERDVKEIGTQLHISLSESARILVKYHGYPTQLLETLVRLSIN